MLKTSFIVIIILKLCIKFKCWKPVFLCGLEETKSSKFLWRKKTPAPFNHSPHQHPSITHLTSTLQSLTSPAPFNHSPLQHPSTHLGLYELTLRRQPCQYQHCTSFDSQVICKKPNMFSVRVRVFFRNTKNFVWLYEESHSYINYLSCSPEKNRAMFWMVICRELFCNVMGWETINS